MKVKVLVDYNDKNLGQVKAGDVIEVSEERYNFLTDKIANPYKVCLVEKVVEEAKKEVKTEKAVKKTTKKSK